MSREDLEREQAGLAADAGMSAEKAKDAKGTLKRLLGRLMEQKGKLMVIACSAIIGCILTMTAPLVIGRGIDIIIDGLKTEGFQFGWYVIGDIVLLLLVIYLLNSAFSYLQQYLMAGISQKLTLSLRMEINKKMERLPLSYYDNHSRGDMMSRVTNDIERVADTLQQGLMQFITSMINIAGAVIIMLVISPVLTCIILVSIFLGLFLTSWVSGFSHKYFLENQKALGSMNGLIEEYLTGRIVVKAFGHEDEARRKVGEANEKLYEAGRKAQFITYAVSPVIRLFNQSGYVLIAVAGAMFVLSGKMSLGIIQAFFQYVSQVAEPITEISYTVNTMQAAIASAERVFEILEEKEESTEQNTADASKMSQGNVVFKNICFGYEDGDVLMKDVSFDVCAGQKVAIVGPTGAGKTTLINLLMRFYEPKSGAITIDGIDIRKVERKELRSRLGMVLQDTWAFGGTIGENIAYSRENASEEEIEKASKAARMDHFVRTLPDGYQTMLGDEAGDLSAGQRQLLTIARAILADPMILILDEATSSVDTRTELEIQKAMDVLMKGRTSFVIAHRLSTILDADKILVMKNGDIIEQGNHRDLMRQNGFYADLYNSQFQG